MLIENLKMSWQNIRQNRMRSFLTALGIVIGVTAVIALITIVNAATSSMMSQITQLGANTLRVTAMGSALKSGVTVSEMNELSEIEGVSGVSPSLSLTTNGTRNLILEENISTEGRNEMYFVSNPDLVSLGRPLNILDMESKNRVCIINEELQKVLFMGENPLLQEILIDGRSFTVVGIIDPEATTDLATAMGRQSGSNVSNGRIIIPYTVAMSMSGTNTITSFEVMVDGTENINSVRENVERALDEAFNYRDDSYFIMNMDSLIDTMNSMMSTMTLMLAGIASISLLVGGIGIMNMMLVSVTERTTEIGLRKALGAEPMQIQFQFLIESIFLSLLGGTFGIILGLSISAIVVNLLGVAFTINMGAIVLGVGFSAGIGILFGWAPARRASRLNPIDALRSA
jgi:putative ABC transport system permease protein